MSETVSVQDLDLLVEKIHAQRCAIDGQKAAMTELNKQLQAMEEKAVGFLKELGRKNYQTPYGTITIHHAWRVKLPSSDEAKAALIAHLRERGLDKKYLTVNSNSLNSLFLADWDAVERDPTFTMPGLEPPTLYEDLRFRSPTES